MEDFKRKKELERDLKDWLGNSFKRLSSEERERIVIAYGRLTESRLQDPLETIHLITDKEFNYGILVVGSLYGICLGILASAVANSLSEILSAKDFLGIALTIFTIVTACLILTLKEVSRGDAKHWRLLEALEEEASKIATTPNVNRDVTLPSDHSPESASSSDQSL